jgi:hypothetical protein
MNRKRIVSVDVSRIRWVPMVALEVMALRLTMFDGTPSISFHSNLTNLLLKSITAIQHDTSTYASK